MSFSPPPITSPAWGERTKRTVVLLALLVIAFIFLRVTDALPIILVSAVLSFVLFPVANVIEKPLLPQPIRSRTLAILLAFVLVFVLLLLLVLVVLPVLIGQIQEFGQRLPRLLTGLEEEITRFLSQPIVIGDQTLIPIDNLREAMGVAPDEALPLLQLQNINLGDAVNYSVRSLTGPAFSFIGGAFNAVINLIFLLTMMFYLLKDGNLFLTTLVNITPATYQGDAARLLHELGDVWKAYLNGQILLGIVMGVIVFITATLLGVPNAPILGLLSGVLEFIPTLGPLMAMIPAVLLAFSSQSSTLPFLEGPTFALVVVVVWIALQQLESVFLVPRIIGDSLNLHPFIVIIGVIAGANLAGALGVILAAPVIASVRVLAQYIYGKLLDRDPFPPPPQLQTDERRNSIFSSWLWRRAQRTERRKTAVK
jgi:predicted PurR-regulated permease PerM